MDRWTLRAPLLFAARRRFVAGTDAKSALDRVRRLHPKAIPILNYLGEDLTDLADVRTTVYEYHRLIAALGQWGRPCRISIKPTQLGLALTTLPSGQPEDSRWIFKQNARELVNVCRSAGSVTLEFDIEDHSTVEPTVWLAKFLAHRFTTDYKVRVAVAARRDNSEAIIHQLNRYGVNVRLVKGHYADSPEDAAKTQDDFRERFRACAVVLLDYAEKGLKPAFATHDMPLIRFVLKELAQRGLPNDAVEFQFLNGMRGITWRWRLLRRGYRVALYLPYGADWLPYIQRRWEFFERLRAHPTELFGYLFN